MFFQEQVNRLSRWFSNGLNSSPALCGAQGGAGSAAAGHTSISRTAMGGSSGPRVAKRPALQRTAVQRTSGQRRKQTRTALLEAMEPRHMMAADMIQVGAVYVEDDIGSDLHGDLFYVSFEGGAPDTQLTRLTIDGDMNSPGFGLGDMFFDTVDGGYGADHAFPFQIVQLRAQHPNATVRATVTDGDTKLVLDFTNFTAGDLLVFSIDVDEVQSYDPNEKDISVLNDGFDPIASGVEFQNSKLSAVFTAPHYEIASGQDKFLNRYDPWLVQSGLELPADNEGGKRDRSAGGGFALQQVPKPISLAGTVYVDANEDLKLQSGEQRLSGVKLDLYRLENGNYVATGHSTTTDAQGRYVFGTNLGLMPGTYQVRESQPAGYYSVGASAGKLNNGTSVGHIVAGNPDVLTQVDVLLGDQHATELNFAENLPASISGHTCVVISGFDCFSSSSEKAPLAGVLIELRNASGQVIATQTTGADGKYSFTNLRAGVYSLTETTPAALLEGDSKVGSSGGVKVNGSQISQITIGGGVTATDYDFCELTPSDLSGHTFYDQNNNGRRDNGELPLSNVLVTLWDDAGSKVAETRTNSQGYYQFNRLRPGTYRVTEQTPSDYVPGQAAVGTVSGKIVGSRDASGDVLSAIVLPAGSHGIDYDFGEILPGSIAGRVISDTNGNCIIDATGDRPLAGVTIELLSASGAVLQTTLTDAQGNYKFDSLLPAEYAIREVQPVGYFQGDHHAGSGGGDASVTDLVRAIYVTPGAALIDYNFCEIPPGSIAGQVYVDADQDCEYDAGESPIAGVTITLLDDSGRVVGTTQTDAAGRYQFNGLAPGRYTVRESQPAGYLQGGQTAGSGGGDTSVPDVISAIQLGAGTALVDYDFCEITPGSIAGTVFVDLDDDCILDANEQPLAGVRMTLLDASGVVVATTLTDSSGNYSFSNLRPGQYSVRETQPAGYYQGGQKAGSGGGDASLQDVISKIILAPGVQLVEYDFCERLPGSIAGVVFADLDFDCILDANESTLSGVKVELLDTAGSVIASTLTDASGKYSFTNLRPGQYAVRETQPQGYFQGGQVAPKTGGDASLDDLISQINVGSGQAVTDANFCEVPPAKISGYVFQDGSVIASATGELPDDIRSIRDGLHTSDDTPIGNVLLQLRALTGQPIDASRALPGIYSGQTIEVRTDANGYFEFTGLRAGTYHVYEKQPDGYIDSLDTPGTTTGFAINRGESVPTSIMSLLQLTDPQANPGTDAILAISVEAGQHSNANNFSEVQTKRENPVPPIAVNPPPLEKVLETPPIYQPQAPIYATPLLWEPLPLLIGYGHQEMPTWHLSVINGGFPRGMRNGEPVEESQVAEQADRLNVYAWSVRGLKDSTWHIVSTNPRMEEVTRRMVFDLPGAQPLAGDFNGDGFDELALFLDGEWFIDINANGRWDESDIWLRLGKKGDQPVIGDWDGDGKDDVGIFGQKWQGDDRAIASEPGLPDPQNRGRVAAKNVPPTPDKAAEDPRLLKRSHSGTARADLIDHVFRFGGEKDIAISGDFNGAGIATIGTYHNGRWLLDVDGDGKLSDEHDEQRQFGEPGDLPLVGDFDGDGIDELAVVRGDQVLVDSNGNGRFDATDQVFQLDSAEGTVVVGDFNGDGRDEPALHQSPDQQRWLEAKREGAPEA
ncbi:MAG: carboxypeptidase regulatory-like domain-containing protein [Pirellulaceae bacterium]|nr:carboxypeptidase regulatory-like domain-containing protein [Pirellulaceae bacterium]